MTFLSILGIGGVIVVGGGLVIALFKWCAKNMLIAVAVTAVAFLLFQNMLIALAVGVLAFVFGFFI